MNDETLDILSLVFWAVVVGAFGYLMFWLTNRRMK